MDDFDRASARTHALACALVESGAVLAGACPEGQEWELVEVPEFVAATTLSEAEFDDAGFDVDDFRHGLHHHGVRLMHEARAKESVWNGLPLVPVGGTLLLFEITKDGHRQATPMGIWPDLIGAQMKRDAPFLKA
jgi:hypothetical protein